MLPSGRHGPLASPELGRGQALASESPAGLAPWQVPALAIAPGAAVDLLLVPPEALRAGASLRYLAEVAKLACELAAAGRVLPALVEEGGCPAARWRPLPAPPDAGQLALLARAMPPICRAERTTSGSAAGDPELEGCPPQVMLGAALEALTDAVVREALAGRSLLPSKPGRRPAHLRATTAWLGALTAATPVVDADPAELAKLARALEEWRRSGLPAAEGVRTCFRLLPPGDGRHPDQAPPDLVWRLELLLQGADDPSLLVPAAEVWRAGSGLALASGRVEHPQERLLADLGRATRLYPELERALAERRPVALDLDTEGAYRFLREAASLLAQAGFGVLTPSWWRSGSARLGLKLTARPAQQADSATAAPGGMGLESLVDYRWQLALGDDPLPAEELRELARLKLPLVRVRGRWVELDPEELDRALGFLER